MAKLEVFCLDYLEIRKETTRQVPRQAKYRKQIGLKKKLPDGHFYNKNSIAKFDVIFLDYLNKKK